MAISGPVPPYSNPPPHPEWFEPRYFYVNSITLGKTTLVQTDGEQDFVIGQLVRLLIPQPSGCRQLNNQVAYVISIPFPNQVVLDLDSSGGDPFISQATFLQPTINPVGDVNTGQINTSGRINNIVYIDGAFKNISP